ncbi:thioesterase, FlK family [Aquitalea denitrificans]|jgi:predicted thioesterase|nr:hypothetical protein [Aquitalea denitrificans]
MPPALATVMILALMKQTCIQGLHPFPAPDQHTVGVHIDICHVIGTPVGMKVAGKLS